MYKKHLKIQGEFKFSFWVGIELLLKGEISSNIHLRVAVEACDRDIVQTNTFIIIIIIIIIIIHFLITN